MDSADVDDLERAVAAVTWYHTIELPGGVRTTGVNASPRALARLRLPDSFAGLSVLDVGAWDGFYSFEAVRRGATRVLATDSFVWRGETWNGTGRRGFDLARRALGMQSAVDDLDVDVMDLSPERVGGVFDVVLLLGVLYHLRDPYGGIERVASVCGQLLVLETELAVNFVPYGAARTYAADELNGDASNWFAFNERALHEMLRAQGFAQVTTVYRTPAWKVLVRVLARAVRLRLPGAVATRSRRVVVHATR